MQRCKLVIPATPEQRLERSWLESSHGKKSVSPHSPISTNKLGKVMHTSFFTVTQEAEIGNRKSRVAQTKTRHPTREILNQKREWFS
jgi:hypothetical protein